MRSTLSGNSAFGYVDENGIDDGNAYGGAIIQISGAHPDVVTIDVVSTLIVDSSTLSGNSAQNAGYAEAGAIDNLQQAGLSAVTVKNSTLAGNYAGGGKGLGGAVINLGGLLTVDNSTLSGNLDDYYGVSGIGNYYLNGAVTIKNTILANNPSGVNLDNSDGTVTSEGYNLSTDHGCDRDGSLLLIHPTDKIDTDPMLDDLADNGGPTWTCAIPADSPAINAADSTDSADNPVSVDQRGVARPQPQGGANDIGAFEAEVVANQPPTLDVSSAPSTGLVGTPVTFTAAATDPDAGDTLTFSLGADAPAGASIAPSTGDFTWTPTTAGTFTFSVIVTDADGLSDTKTVTVTVTGLTVSGATAARNGKIVTVTVMINNPTTITAYDVMVTASSLDGSNTSSALPLVYGAIKPGVSKKCTLQFKSVPSGSQTLTVQGTSSLGNFFTTQTLNVP